MEPRRILVVYGTHYGQTGKIAQRMAERLAVAGDAVTLVSGDALPRGLTPRDFDGVVVGASVNYGRHQRCIRRFVTVTEAFAASLRRPEPAPPLTTT